MCIVYNVFSKIHKSFKGEKDKILRCFYFFFEYHLLTYTHTENRWFIVSLEQIFMRGCSCSFWASLRFYLARIKNFNYVAWYASKLRIKMNRNSRKSQVAQSIIISVLSKKRNSVKVCNFLKINLYHQSTYECSNISAEVRSTRASVLALF